MKKGLLIFSALTFGILAGQAQNVKAHKLSKATTAQKAMVSQVANKKMADAFAHQFNKNKSAASHRADGVVTPLYCNPAGAFYYGISDEGSNFYSARMITGAYDDVTFTNYTRDASRNKIKDVTWSWAYGDGEEATPSAQNVDEDGNLTAQAYGSLPFPTVKYGSDSYAFATEKDNESYPAYWEAGSADLVNYPISNNEQTGGVYNAIIQLGFYGGFGEGKGFNSNQNFNTLENKQWKDTGKKLTGFAEYFVKPVSTVYAEGITSWFWTENLTEGHPLDGKQLTATIYTFNGNQMVEYASAIAKESDATAVGANGLYHIDFKFVEEDPVLGEVESPITLPEEDFFVILTGFDQINGTFTAPFASCDGWDGYGYALLEDGSISTIGYSNEPETPQVSLFIGFRAAFPVAHYSSDNLPKVLFEAEGGIGAGTYDEEEQKFGGYVMIASMTAKDKWNEEECPEWVSYQLDDQYVEQYGIMVVELTAEALPTGVDSREGTVVLDVYGKKVEIPVYQAAGAITSISNTTMKVDAKVGQCFNMAGQRVSEGYQGLVIKNGKKYIVK